MEEATTLDDVQGPERVMSQLVTPVPPGEGNLLPADSSLSTQEFTLDLEPAPSEERATLMRGVVEPAQEPQPEQPGSAASPAEGYVGLSLHGGKYQVLGLRQCAGGQGFLYGETARLGTSYIGLHTDLQKRLTVHVLPLDPAASPEERDQTTGQFIREVRVLARLSHPSLPIVHDYFCEGDACYVIMADLAERTLATVLAEAAQEQRVPALPPLELARLGLELVRALRYLHQQRPPLVLGGLRPEDVALPQDGPAQVVSLGALSMVASSPTLPGQTQPALPAINAAPSAVDGEAPTEPALASAEQVSAASESAIDTLEASTLPSVPLTPKTPDRRDDLWSLGVLLRDLAGGAGVVAGVMERQRHPEQAAGEEEPPISLALAEVIEMASDEDPEQRFQNAAAFEQALRRALEVEQRIARLVARATQREQGAATVDMSLELEQENLATRQFPVVRSSGASRPFVACWKCGGRNRPGASFCRVCGARQPTLTQDDLPRPRRRTTRRLPDETLPRTGRYSSPRTTAALPRQRDPWRQVLWMFVWACFAMALLLGSTSALVAYRALH
jgi:serine/threonine protein kinase